MAPAGLPNFTTGRLEAQSRPQRPLWHCDTHAVHRRMTLSSARSTVFEVARETAGRIRLLGTSDAPSMVWRVAVNVFWTIAAAAYIRWPRCTQP